MTRPLRLKPWLFHVLDGEVHLLLSDVAVETLARGKIDGLLPLLDGSRAGDDIADALADVQGLAETYYLLDQLRTKGLVEEVPLREPSAEDQFRDRLGCGPTPDEQPVRIAAVGDLDMTIAHAASERLSRVPGLNVQDCSPGVPNSPDALWVVLAESYLEPQLEACNRAAIEAETRWLPCKPTGLEPWIGPLFTPNQTPCLECLLHRLRGHRIHEARHALEVGAAPRLAQGHSHASLDTVCSLIALELEKTLCGSEHAFLHKGVVSMDLRTLETRRHRLVRRPACPVCGDATPRQTSLSERALVLTSRPKSAYKDGGQRIQEAAETLKPLESLCSPITGEVASISNDDEVPPLLGHVARSSWSTPNAGRTLGANARGMAVGVSTGKGLSETQARMSALGEALERYCTQFFGCEPRFRAAWEQVCDHAVHPRCLNPFSDSQYSQRHIWAARGESGVVPEPWDEATPLDWTPAWSLTHGQWKYVPTAYVYFRSADSQDSRFIHANSNGVAAGNCLEEALVYGFLELLERDAVALWWYNRLRKPPLHVDSFDSAFASKTLRHAHHLSRCVHVLDLTSDLGIPVFAAVSLAAPGVDAEPSLGFGAHLDPRIALNRAISELAQAWNLSKRMEPNALAKGITGRALGEELFLRPRKDVPSIPLDAFPRHDSDNFLVDIEHCMALLRDKDIELLVADLTRAEVGLSVVRVIAPGLMNFWPRFAAPRLYTVPVEMGWLDASLREEDLYPVPFFL